MHENLALAMYIYMTLLLIAPFDLPEEKLESERLALRGPCATLLSLQRLATLSITKITHQPCLGEGGAASLTKLAQ